MFNSQGPFPPASPLQCGVIPQPQPRRRSSDACVLAANRNGEHESPMPEGLLRFMTKEEVLDLVAYTVSGGDAKHEVFAN